MIVVVPFATHIVIIYVYECLPAMKVKVALYGGSSECTHSLYLFRGRRGVSF